MVYLEKTYNKVLDPTPERIVALRDSLLGGAG